MTDLQLVKPYYGMTLTPQARIFLHDFWIRYPKNRHACVTKYGFDPIIEEEKYWRYGIAEKDHSSILQKIKITKKFTLPLARQWAIQERR